MSRKDKALTQIDYATDWIIGGHVNAVSDGYEDAMPHKRDVILEIYNGVLNNTYSLGCEEARPNKDIRFCGKDWLLIKIKERVERDPEYARN